MSTCEKQGDGHRAHAVQTSRPEVRQDVHSKIRVVHVRVAGMSFRVPTSDSLFAVLMMHQARGRAGHGATSWTAGRARAAAAHQSDSVPWRAGASGGLRPEVVRRQTSADGRDAGGKESAAEQAREADPEETARRQARGQCRASLMARTFGFDVLACLRADAPHVGAPAVGAVVRRHPPHAFFRA